MDQKTRTIIIGGVVLLILAAVSGTIFYLSRISKVSDQTTSTDNSLPQVQISPAPSSAPRNTPGASANGLKTFVGPAFSIQYPQNWALLTCSNSQNIELDPYGGNNIQGVVCDFAVKPVTFLVANKLSCQGETVKLGNNQVVRSKTTGANGDINYRWCVPLVGKSVDITHRVSASGSRATSKDDFSAQVEKIITELRPVTGS